MYNFILQIVIMLALGVAIYMMARAIPRISDDIHRPAGRFHHWMSSLHFEKLDVLLSNFLEKFLRKVKLLLMKVDNATNDYLDKIKKTKPNGNSQKMEEEKPGLFSSSSEIREKGKNLEE